VWAAFSTIRFLTFHRASRQEYIVVEFKDGNREILMGPCTLFENPVQHTRVHVKTALQVNSSEALVVYTDCRRHAPPRSGAELGAAGLMMKSADIAMPVLPGSGVLQGGGRLVASGGVGSGLARHVLVGPALWVPKADEWLHSFSWSGDMVDVAGKASHSPDAPFEKLDLNPRALAYTVKEVRTTDEASLDLKFVITMQLHNVEKMLDASKDPIRSLALAMSADVLGFGGAHTLEEMLTKTAELNNLDSFPRLRAAAEEAGFNIMNVLCKGYKSSPELEQMWAETVSTRQRQRMQAAHEAADTAMETEQRQTKLAKAEQDADDERRMLQQRLTLKAQQAEFDAAKEREQHERELAMRAERFDQHLLLSQRQDAATIGALSDLKNIGVDLDRYLENLALTAARVGGGDKQEEQEEGDAALKNKKRSDRQKGDPALKLARLAFERE
jgi:hypothetical protein